MPLAANTAANLYAPEPAASTSHAVDSVACRFLFGNAADDVLQKWLEADMRAAQLSWVFRAYYRVRPILPLPVRHFLQRHCRPGPSPGWYYPNDCTNALADCISSYRDGIATIHPWPDENDFAFVLTHDVETADGMRRVAGLADLEEELGYRSSWNIVPHKYPVDRGLLSDLSDRGFEIGVHGYNHDGKLFFSRDLFNRRAPKINAALKSHGAVGFRAPMVHRNLAWLQSLDIEYDASCFDVDPYQAMSGGIGSVWPFIAGRFVELPYTLPQDHTLFIALGERDGRIWHNKLRYLAKLRGLALLLTHPDYLDSVRRLDAYRRLLQEARALGGAWPALPKEVAAWWRARDESRLRQGRDGRLHIEGPAAERGRAAIIRATAPDPTSGGHIENSLGNGAPAVALEWNDLATAREATPSPARRNRLSDNSNVSSR
jgi:peptidoglycan/xylan/chitin deacetylase (PgdA/CDA1 family)